MPHARKQIRDQLVTIITSLSVTGSNVFNTRVYDHNVLPCLTVYVDADTVDDEMSTPTTEWHELQIRVEARAKAKSSVEDTIDSICSEVEAAIFADDTLNGKVKQIILDETLLEFSGEQDQPVALATLALTAYYRIASGSPETILN